MITRPSELPSEPGMVAVDTETSGRHVDDGARVSVVSLSWRDDDGTLVSCAFPFNQGTIGKPEGAQGSLLDVDHNLDSQDWMDLLIWLADREHIYHNAKFDLMMLRAGSAPPLAGMEFIDCFKWDTMVAQRELDPLEAVGLKATAERLGLTDGNERDKETEVKEWLKAHAKRTKQKISVIGGRYDLVPWEIIGPYAAKDTELTWLLWENQMDRIDEGEGDLRAIEREMNVMRVLYQIEKRGMGFDAGECLESAGVLQAAMEEQAKKLPFEPTVNSAKRYFFDQQGVPPYEATEGGKPKLNEQVLAKMVKDRIPMAAEFAEYRKMEVAMNMWYGAYPTMIGDDGRLRTSFRQTKVVSGRFSVERVQLQAIPHDHRIAGLPEGVRSVRSMFKPRPGFELWEMDLSQAELRVAAKFARCESMLTMFKEGRDIHGWVTEEVFDVHPGEPNWFKYRQVGKRADFSFIFGVGADTFRATVAKLLGIEFSRDEAQRIVQRWRDLFPEFQRAIHKADRLAQERGWVKLITGKRSYFGRGEQTHKAFNRVVQGSLAEMNKDWIVAVEEEVPDVLVMSTHDSIDLEIPEGETWMVEKAAKIGERVGREMFGLEMPVEWKRWGE